MQQASVRHDAEQRRSRTHRCERELSTFDCRRRNLFHRIPHCAVKTGEQGQEKCDITLRTLVVILVELSTLDKFLADGQHDDGLSSLRKADLAQTGEESGGR